MKKSLKIHAENPDIPDVEPHNCCLCGLGFWVYNQSDQELCDYHNSEEFQENYRKRLSEFLAHLFLSWGCSTKEPKSIFSVARRCVEAEYKNVERALRALGYFYDLPSDLWMWYGR